jgi:hypothetical protein
VQQDRALGAPQQLARAVEDLVGQFRGSVPGQLQVGEPELLDDGALFEPGLLLVVAQVDHGLHAAVPRLLEVGRSRLAGQVDAAQGVEALDRAAGVGLERLGRHGPVLGLLVDGLSGTACQEEGEEEDRG